MVQAKPNLENFYALTAKTKEIIKRIKSRIWEGYSFKRNNFKNINEQFLHTQFFALVDKNGKLRKKIYDGLKKNELKELEQDIAVLLKEPASDSRFANNLFGK